MPSDDGAGVNEAEPGFPTIPDLGEPRPQSAVDWSQPRTVGTPAQDQQLVAQSQVLQQQVPAGFQPGHDQTAQKKASRQMMRQRIPGNVLESQQFQTGRSFCQRQRIKSSPSLNTFKPRCW